MTINGAMPQPFYWGEGGAESQRERSKRIRQIAEAMLERSKAPPGGIDTSPVAHWTQGAARVADAMAGAYRRHKEGKEAKSLMGQADEADRLSRERSSAAMEPIIEAMGGTSRRSQFPAAPGQSAAPQLQFGEDEVRPQGYRASLIDTESGGNWSAQNNEVGAGGKAGHFGRVQFGHARLQDAMNAGAIPQGTTPQQFMASPELQKAAENWHFADLEKQLSPYVGAKVNGQTLDLGALVAMGHLGGADGARKYVETGGQYNPSDSFGTSLSEYARTHGGKAQPASNGQQAIEQAMAGQGAPSGQETSFERFIGLDTPGNTMPVAQPQQLNSAMIMQALQEPDLDQSQRQMLEGMLQQEMQKQQQASDPLRQMQIEQQRLELDAMKNPKTEAPKPTDDMREFELAKSQGFQGSFIDFMQAQKGNGMSMQMPDGTVVQMGGSQKPFTEAQSKDNVFSTRARGALEVLDPIANSLVDRSETMSEMLPMGMGGTFGMQSDNFQVARTAGNEFLQAILRKDTGAAITDQEQLLYGKTYLPEPGDNEARLAYKAQARQRAIAAIEAGMSPAQMLAKERALEKSAQPTPASPAAQPMAVPEGIDPADWEFMTPEERALFR